MTEQIERQIIQLIATDRIDVPISSMSGKLKRAKPKLAKGIDLSQYDGDFQGDRVNARVESDEKMTARGMKEGIEIFEGEFPRHGQVLRGYIEAERAKKETRIYFGTNPDCRLTSDDYMGVMKDLGFSETRAEALYGELMNVSRNLSRKRDGERSVLIG